MGVARTSGLTQQRYVKYHNGAIRKVPLSGVLSPKRSDRFWWEVAIECCFPDFELLDDIADEGVVFGISEQ